MPDTDTLVRLDDSVVHQRSEDRARAFALFESAIGERDTILNRVARSALGGDLPKDADRAEVASADQAVAAARADWQAARVEWAHARGVHLADGPSRCCRAGETA